MGRGQAEREGERWPATTAVRSRSRSRWSGAAARSRGSRPSLWRIRPDWTTLRLAAKMIPKLKSGDDVLLRGVIDMIEDAGFRVRGVHELVPDLLAGKGNLAGTKPSRTAMESIATAVDGALALGSLDAGQACVAAYHFSQVGISLILKSAARSITRIPASSKDSACNIAVVFGVAKNTRSQSL